MQDIFLSRLWADDHARFSAGVDKGIDQLRQSFRRPLSPGNRLLAMGAALALSAASVATATGPFEPAAAPTAGYHTPVSV